MNQQRRNLTPIQVCFPPELTIQLDEQAQREGIRSRSLLLRRAAIEYLAQKAVERGEDPTPILKGGIR